MLADLVRRVMWLPVMLVIVAFVTFALRYCGLADPLALVHGQRYDPEIAGRLAQEHGLDQPFVIQLVRCLGHAAGVDLGDSIKDRNQPVTGPLLPRLAVTMQNDSVASSVGVAAGIVVGGLAALQWGTSIDRLAIPGVVPGKVVPASVAGLILLFLLARVTPLLPPGGWQGIFRRGAVLPVLLLSMGPMVGFARRTRAGILGPVGHHYVRTARGTGVPSRRIVARRLLRNALPPVTVLVSRRVGGIILSEAPLSFPGHRTAAARSHLGRTLYQTYSHWRTRLWPLLIIPAGVVVAITLAFNFLGDGLNDALNPQVT